MTTMNPETRRLIRVMPEEAEADGPDVRPAAGRQPPGARKDYIAAHGSEYIDLTDIS